MPYFDHNATTPLAAVARETWLRAQDEAWQNASSPYRAAAQVKIRLEAAREKFAILLGDQAERYVFTSGATEAANAVVAWWAKTLPADALIAVNPTEHACVLEPLKQHFGDRLKWLKLSSEAVVDIKDLKICHLLSDKLDRGMDRKKVAAVVVMAANNETGVVQPWNEIAVACAEAGVAYLCDASQWLGKLPAGGIGGNGFVIAAAHKFGGPKGVGLLKLAPQSEGLRGQLGGGQERGQRGGTEDFPGIAAMGAALAEAEQKKVFLETERLAWREEFEHAVAAAVPGVQVVGGGRTDQSNPIGYFSADRLWNTVSLVMPFAENTRWVTRLDKRGFQVSTGSACATGKGGPSHVLAAMGFDVETAKRVVRVSSGWETTREDWQALAAAFGAVAGEVRPA